MTDICERRSIDRVESETSRALAAFVAEHRAGDGSIRIALRLPVMMFAAWKSALERCGVADFYALRSSGDPFPTYSVTWSSGDGGAFPVFAGALAIERLSDRDRCGLLLAGHYEPPLGPLGAVFDAVVGRRVARASARELLAAIAAYVERRPDHIAQHHLTGANIAAVAPFA